MPDTDALLREAAEAIALNPRNAEHVAGLVHCLRSKLAPLIADAERFQFIADDVRASSLHMDGTADYSIRHRFYKRAKTFRDSIDAARKEPTDHA